MKFMFVHPSRGRPILALKAAERMINSMESNTPFTYYLSLDADDLTVSKYIKSDFITEIVINDNKGCVDAVNQAGKRHQDEDLIIVNGDDFGIKMNGWDTYILNTIKKIDTQEYLLHFPHIHNSERIAIAQMLSGSLYKRLGNIFYYEYMSMYADSDLWETCNQLGAIHNYEGPDLFFHDHPSVGGTMQWDDTYKHTNRSICYETGIQIFKRRRQEGFPPRYS